MKYICFAIFWGTLSCTPLFAGEKQKIALLFLVTEDHHQDRLWAEALRKQGDKFNVYVHPKGKLRNPFFALNIVQGRAETSWMYHLGAWHHLLRCALENKSNQRFIFLSESCVPLRSLDHIYKTLMAEKKSFVNYSKPWWSAEEQREVRELPAEHRWVNSEWVALNRKHAQMMIEDSLILPLVEKHDHSCEAYASCLFSFYNCLEGHVVNKPITYVDFILGGDSHPYIFKEATPANIEMLRKAKKEGFLFARKIARSFPTQTLLEIINER